MKLLIIAALITLASCSKEKIETPAQQADVTNVTFGPAYAGANLSIKFRITLNIKGSVKRAMLNRIPFRMVWYINSPESQTYTMYDHMVDTYPTYPQQRFYQVVFEMQDGSTISCKPFQVY